MILYKNLPEPMTALTRYSDTEFICLQGLPRTCSGTHSPSYYYTQSPCQALQGDLTSLIARTETSTHLLCGTRGAQCCRQPLQKPSVYQGDGDAA